MWLFTKIGFYSIVKEHDSKKFLVRGRTRKDIVNLINAVPCLKDKKVVHTPIRDYHFRIIVSQRELTKITTLLSEEVDYTNFKNEVKQSVNQKDKVNLLNKVWWIMFEYQRDSKKTPKKADLHFYDSFSSTGKSAIKNY